MKQIFKIASFVGVLVAISFFAYGCNSVKPVSQSQLEGDWTLKLLKNEEATKLFGQDNLPSIKFNFTDNTVTGNASCNNYRGGFTLTPKNEFSAPNIITTLKMCQESDKEFEFLTALSTPNLTVSVENELLLFKQNKTTVLQFEKGKSKLGADALIGKWTLSSIAEGDLVSLFSGNIPTMEFSVDNTVNGNAGCNNYRTTYKLENNVLTLAPVALTKKACPGLDGEYKFVSYLGTSLRVAINGQKLALSDESGKVVLGFTKDK